MAIQHAVLSLLTDGPSHGYELRVAFERAVGPQWGGLNIGHLYQVLDRLSRDGLVTSSVVPMSDRPDRRVYELTDAGREELEAWLGSAALRSGGYRDDFMLKLMAAARMGRNRVRQVVDLQRRHELGRLKALDQLSREHHDEPLARLLIDAAVLRSKADLELLDRADLAASELVTKAPSVRPADEPSRTEPNDEDAHAPEPAQRHTSTG